MFDAYACKSEKTRKEKKSKKNRWNKRCDLERCFFFLDVSWLQFSLLIFSTGAGTSSVKMANRSLHGLEDYLIIQVGEDSRQWRISALGFVVARTRKKNGSWTIDSSESEPGCLKRKHWKKISIKTVEMCNLFSGTCNVIMNLIAVFRRRGCISTVKVSTACAPSCEARNWNAGWRLPNKSIVAEPWFCTPFERLICKRLGFQKKHRPQEGLHKIVPIRMPRQRQLLTS